MELKQYSFNNRRARRGSSLRQLPYSWTQLRHHRTRMSRSSLGSSKVKNLYLGSQDQGDHRSSRAMSAAAEKESGRPTSPLKSPASGPRHRSSASKWPSFIPMRTHYLVILLDPQEPEPGIPMLLCDPSSLTFPDSSDIPLLQQECIWWQHIIHGLKRKDPEYSIRRLNRIFLIKNNVLYHRFIRHGQAFHQLCVPSKLVDQVLLACHDDVTAGHLGRTRTLSKINKRFFWPKMTQQVTSYVRSCEECQNTKKPKQRPVGYLEPIRIQQPFEKVRLDIIGPFSFLNNGNRHVVIAVDYFTKWVIAKAIPTANTAELVNLFIQRVL